METLKYCPHGFTKNANRSMRTGGGHGIWGQKKILRKPIGSTTNKTIFLFNAILLEIIKEVN